MVNKLLYCLNCEDNFTEQLRYQNFEIIKGYLGYKYEDAKILNLQYPPNESDAIIFNLTKPACFNRMSWGPGANDNYNCKIEEKIDKSVFFIEKDNKKYPKFRLIYESQIYKNDSIFSYEHLKKAVVNAGIDFIFFLNPEYLFHSLYEIPGFLDINFITGITNAKKWMISERLLIEYPILSEIGQKELGIKLPIEFVLLDIKCKDSNFSRDNLIVNNLNESFATIIKYGQGFIWFLPPFVNQSVGTAKIINSIIPSFKNIYFDKLKKVVKAITQSKKVSTKLTESVEDLLSLDDFGGIRDYLDKVIKQINGCYKNGYYDACAAMMRRLIESLIIETYDSNGRLSDIKDKGEIITLEKLIGKLTNHFHITRNVKKTLDIVKMLGDTSSHNWRVNLSKNNIDDIKSEIKIAVKELIKNIK